MYDQSIQDLKFISDPSLPPTKLKVKLQGEAKKHKGDQSGAYTLQPNLVNGYPTWMQISSRNSIWLYSHGVWVIGFTSDLGSNTAGIIGPNAEDDWPQNLSGWKYGDYSKNCFVYAGSDVVIEDYSKGIKTNFYSKSYFIHTIFISF